MRVKQLKELLAKWVGVVSLIKAPRLRGDCKGCTEKVEFINRIKELKPKTEGAKTEL